MKDTIVVGDIHGRLDIVTRALKLPYNIVFVGDYLDSFDESIDSQVMCLNKVLLACEQEPERVQGLLGNHELSYIMPGHKCSGWNSVTDLYVRHLETRMTQYLKPYTWVGNFLVTHAGLSRRLLWSCPDVLEKFGEKPQGLEPVRYFLESEDTEAWHHNIGWARGGMNKVGGIFWNDYFQEFTEIQGVPQIFGHTGFRKQRSKNKGVLQKGNAYNIDCLDYIAEAVLVNDKGISIINLDETIWGGPGV